MLDKLLDELEKARRDRFLNLRTVAELAESQGKPAAGKGINASLLGVAKGDFEAFCLQQAARYAFAPPKLIRRLCRAYGTRIERIMGNAQALSDLGEEVAPQLYEAELQYMRDHEWARTGEDAAH